MLLKDHLELILTKNKNLPPVVTMNELGSPPFMVIRFGGMALNYERPSTVWMVEVYSGYSDSTNPDKNLEYIAEQVVETIMYSNNGIITGVVPARFVKLAADPSSRLYDGTHIYVRDINSI